MNTTQEVSLANLIEGLSLAVDLAENKPLRHAQNVTFLALQIANELGLSARDKNALYYAGLLHDITFTSLDKPCPICDAIKEYNLGHLAPTLLQADDMIHKSLETWDGSGPQGFCGENTPLAARLLKLVIHIDDFQEEKRNFWQWQKSVMEMLDKGSGTAFDPSLVQLVKRLFSNRRFCLDLLEPNPVEEIQRFRPVEFIPLSGDLSMVIGKAFARFIDNKSSYTANHSQDVAKIAVLMAQKLKLPKETISHLHLAALLHDLGKVAIPTEILEKQGSLTNAEYAAIKNHPYFTAFILDKIPELGRVSLWASAHHERLDGSGYFLGAKAGELPLEARLIAIADIYAALAADRPYRKSMERTEIRKILSEMKHHGYLDAGLVDLAIAL